MSSFYFVTFFELWPFHMSACVLLKILLLAIKNTFKNTFLDLPSVMSQVRAYICTLGKLKTTIIKLCRWGVCRPLKPAFVERIFFLCKSFFQVPNNSVNTDMLVFGFLFSWRKATEFSQHYSRLAKFRSSLRPKARGLAQYGRPPGWLEEIDPAGVMLYVMDGPYRLPFPYLYRLP
jgi:hypothetical protein